MLNETISIARRPSRSEAGAREPGEVELDGFVEFIDDIVHAGDLAHKRPVVGQERPHDPAKHDFHDVGHAQRLARRICQGK
jgi:hypothetical protein